MYTVIVKKEFEAHHFLAETAGGQENRKHAHRYEMTVQLEGYHLDARGYLIDINDIGRNLDELVAHYRGKTLNELPEFKGMNPSIEHFSRILCAVLSEEIRAPNVHAITVSLAESRNAAASYRRCISARRPYSIR